MSKIHRKWADLSLLGITLIWGSTFIVVKKAIADLPPFPFLAVRFALAFLSLLPFLWPKRNYINKRTVFTGLALGVFLFSGYALQTLGMLYTSASKAGFITGLSVVLVPAFVAIATKKLPQPTLILGITSATFGLALLSLGNQLQLNQGDLLVFFGAIGFALHIFFVGRYAPQADATVLATGQIFSVALLSTLASFILPQPALHFSANAWMGIFLTAIPATSLAFFVQTKMQQFTTSSHTALIFASEPVFSAIFAFILAGEILPPRGLVGALLVLIGMLASEFTGSKGSEAHS